MARSFAALRPGPLLAVAAALALTPATRAGAGSDAGIATDVAVAGARFVAVGSQDDGGDPDWWVAAQDVKTGAPLWDDTLVVPPGPGDDRANAVAVLGSRVFSVGETTVAGNQDFLVRATDLATGAFLWDQQLDPNGSADVAHAVAAAGNRVFVAGEVGNGVDTEDADFYVAAYDAATGAPLWDDTQNPDMGGDGATAIAARGRLVVAVGSVRHGIDTDWLVRAYDARTGAFLWGERYDASHNTDYATTVAIRGRTVIVGGASAAGSSVDWYVRAYDARTGAFLWDDRYDPGGAVDGVSALAIRGRRAFAVGQIGVRGSDADWYVRAYDVRTGAMLWDDQLDVASGSDGATDVTVTGGLVAVVGFVSNGTDGDAMVRVYEGRSGDIAFEEQHDEGGQEILWGVAARGKRLLTVGSASAQFFTRALDLP